MADFCEDYDKLSGSINAGQLNSYHAAYQSVVGKLEGKMSFERPWEIGIKWGVDWIQLAPYSIQWRNLVKTVPNLRVP
jgi:hypothetical protein